MEVCCLFWLPKVIQEFLIKKFLDEVDSLLLRRTCRHFRELIPIPIIECGTMFGVIEDAVRRNRPDLFDYLLGIYMTMTKIDMAFCTNDNEYILEYICKHDSLKMLLSYQKHVNDNFSHDCNWIMIRDMKFEGRLWKYMTPVMLSSFKAKWLCLNSLIWYNNDNTEDYSLKVEWLFRNGINIGFFERLIAMKTKYPPGHRKYSRWQSCLNNIFEAFPQQMKRYFTLSEGWKDYESKKRTAEECFPELFDMEQEFGKKHKLIKRNI